MRVITQLGFRPSTLSVEEICREVQAYRDARDAARKTDEVAERYKCDVARHDQAHMAGDDSLVDDSHLAGA